MIFDNPGNAKNKMVNRKNIYYWKCDRPSAFYALEGKQEEKSNITENLLHSLLSDYFGDDGFNFRPAGGQGNHLTYIVSCKNIDYFLRIEDGPECDNYIGIESKVMDMVRACEVPTPKIFTVDSSRTCYPFAYQLMEFIDYPDLNSIDKKGLLDPLSLGEIIGENIARWQIIKPAGFGLFNPEFQKAGEPLYGLHENYPDYFLLNLDRHLDFLTLSGFLSLQEKKNLQDIVQSNMQYLQIDKGCLVHKDLAFWNILGTKEEIKSFIDWDDSISGDPTDDLSLLSCFQCWPFMETVLKGYQNIKPLPENFESRFWLHLLRNMIVKAVIRVGAGYFDRKDDFFLIGSGSNGKSLETTTRERIQLAYLGLTGKAKLTDL